MKLSLAPGEGSYAIRAYSPGQIQINETAYTISVLVTADTLIDDWPPQAPDELVAAHLQHVLDLEPEVVLLGTGAEQRFPAREILRTMLERNVGMEVMDTGSAARTFNIIMNEGRRVVAALMP